MSTRTAQDDSVFHQSRYASSSEFERGLIANLVAKRVALLDDKADRELIWFVQHLSHQPGGLAAMAAELLEKFSHRLGTPTMLKIKDRKSSICTAEEVAAIRREIPCDQRRKFPLRGETKNQLIQINGDRLGRLRQSAENARMLMEMADSALDRLDRYEAMVTCRQIELDAEDALEREAAKKHPTSYPIESFNEICRQAAIKSESENVLGPLEKELFDLCLKPSRSLTVEDMWYFADFVNVVRDLKRQWIEEKSKVVVTALGQRVYESLDYSEATRSLVLLEGDPRLGKSFSARAWCNQHPGRARFIEVPATNDDASFYRAIARGIGLGNFLKYKVTEIRDRVESVLLSGDLLLVLDEAQRLWPQRNLRYGFPSRILWVMTLVNAGVPVCLVSTPQFIQTQKALEKTGWNSSQLTGRIGYYEFLPTDLSESDLMAVARSVMPAANDKILQALADYASTSTRYLAAVESIAKRALFIAQRKGRADCSAEDVRIAMTESVIPSDTKLVRTLEKGRASFNGQQNEPQIPVPVQIEQPVPVREVRPAVSSRLGSVKRADELIKA